MEMREKIDKLKLTVCKHNCKHQECRERTCYNEGLSDALALFPPILSVEELRDKIKKHLDWNYDTIKVDSKHFWSIKELAKFLLPKPQLSAEEKECEHNKEMTQRKEIAKLLFKRKDMIPNNSMWLAAEIQDLFIKPEGPEPPKKIEELNFNKDDHTGTQVEKCRSKINQLVRAIEGRGK